MTGDIRKFEEVGTHPAANHNAIMVALAFHCGIGGARKLARLRSCVTDGRGRSWRRVREYECGRRSTIRGAAR